MLNDAIMNTYKEYFLTCDTGDMNIECLTLC